MFLSLALILLAGLSAGWLCRKACLPALLGMLFTGILLGPYVLDLIDPSILDISTQIRKTALIIILMRAGLSLDLKDLKKVGRPAVLMCFVPACFEMAAMILIAPKLLGLTLTEAAVTGAVVAAVSPAVIVPKMLGLMEEGYGKKNSIPQLVLAGASVDDVFVIVMFSAFTGLAQNGEISTVSFLKIPVSIVLGILCGAAAGWLFGQYMKKIHIRDTVKMIILMCISFLFVTAEDSFGKTIPFSSLIAVMCTGLSYQKVRAESASRISERFSKVWVLAEILLFVLVGATVNIQYAVKSGISAMILIFAVLVFRMLGVFCCFIFTSLSVKERLFCMISYIPKATVQAAIGGIPLSMGLACGETVLTVAVLSIIITAPLGAFLIERTHRVLLEK
ncbi:MAG: cation:proton antiporter [Oscillospiraceae bacterium]|nr:cation:proton antiporter [Oscillospiraceae bacterium]